ncbi:MAG: EamA family transporter [Conexivisphaerales archaeon]
MTIVRAEEKGIGTREVLMLSVVVLLWGASFTLIKLGLEGVPPIEIAFLRFLIATAFFVTAGYFTDRRVFRLDVLKDWKLLIAIGLAGVTLCNIFQNVGLQYTTASDSSLILASNPVFIVLFAWLFLKERTKATQIVGVALALLGLVFIVGPSKISFGLGSTLGDLLTLLAAISWAAYSIIGKTALSRYGALKVTFFSNLFGTALFLPPLFAFETLVLPSSPWLWLLLGPPLLGAGLLPLVQGAGGSPCDQSRSLTLLHPGDLGGHRLHRAFRTHRPRFPAGSSLRDRRRRPHAEGPT